MTLRYTARAGALTLRRLADRPSSGTLEATEPSPAHDNPLEGRETAHDETDDARRGPCARGAVGPRNRRSQLRRDEGLGVHEGEGADGQGSLLRRRRSAAGHRGAVRRAGCHADHGELPQERHQGIRQRHADAGAAEHRGRLVHAGDRRLARRARLDEQHVPQKRPALRQPHDSVRLWRPPGRVDRAVRRAGRAQGRPGRVGRRPQRDDPRADDRLPVVLLGPRRGDELHRVAGRAAVRRRVVHHGVRAPVRPSRRVRGAGAVPRRRTGRRRPAGPGRCRDIQPRARDADAGARLRHRQVRPERMDLRLDERQPDELRQGALLQDEERHGLGRHPRQGAVGRRKGADRRRPVGGADRRHARPGRGADGEPLPRPALPHVRQPRDRELAELARRARASAATSPSTSRRSSRPRPPPTLRCSRRASCPRRRTSTRASTGRQRTSRCSSTSPRGTSPTCSSSACRRRTSSSTSSSASSRRSCRAARRTRPSTTSTSMVSRTVESPRARGSSGRPTRRQTRCSRTLAS